MLHTRPSSGQATAGAHSALRDLYRDLRERNVRRERVRQLMLQRLAERSGGEGAQLVRQASASLTELALRAQRLHRHPRP
jgi:hypothetical protein